MRAKLVANPLPVLRSHDANVRADGVERRAGIRVFLHLGPPILYVFVNLESIRCEMDNQTSIFDG